MKTFNEVIPQGIKGVKQQYGLAYNSLHQSLAINMTIQLSRIFDLSANYHPHLQDKASIPVLAALLRQAGVGELLMEQAARATPSAAYVFPPADEHKAEIDRIVALDHANEQKRYSHDCSEAIRQFLDLASKVDLVGSVYNIANNGLREIRNKRLAHSLFDKDPNAMPRYSDLDLMLDLAKSAVIYGSMAVEGANRDFDDLERDMSENAQGFAQCVVDGLRRASEQQ